ncbi:MAG: hypothetical protein AAFZ01_07510 [Pseudomonadota bacterium]
MLPFFHPSSVVVVDDDPIFLESFAFHFDELFVCETFSRPEEAIAHFKSKQDHPGLVRGLFSGATDHDERGLTAEGDPIMRMDGARLKQLVGDESRFRELSLLIVDFSMPGLNGIDVCRQLKDHPARKLLLTGKAGKDTAVQAFNEGLIDSYHMKQEAGLSQTLAREVLRLQELYFRDVTRPIELAFEVQNTDLAKHEGFCTYFGQVRDARGVAEYYRMTQPSGVALITEDGHPMFLVVQDEETQKSAVEIAMHEGAPDELLHMLRSRSVVAMFPDREHAYTAVHASDWSKYVWPATVLPGDTEDNTLYVSLLEGADATTFMPDNMCTFADFQQARDAA